MIEVRNLSRYYGDFCALNDVSFRIADREVVGFLGRNGAGKSTTLRILAGLLMPSSGTVTIDGVDMTEVPTGFRARIGFLPETPPLYEDMTVADFLRYMGRLRSLPAEAVETRLGEVMQRTQITDRADQLIGELSHGYRKRVGIAQAIMHRPRLVILDEPISGLDPAQIRSMRQVIRALAEESTVLISSHNLPEVGQTCDRVLVLSQGRLVDESGQPDPVLAAGLAGSVQTAQALHISLTLSGDPARIEQALAGLALVSGHTLRSGGGVSLAHVRLAEDQPEALVRHLVEAGVGVRRVEDGLAVQLEDVFLDLTEDGK